MRAFQRLAGAFAVAVTTFSAPASAEPIKSGPLLRATAAVPFVKEVLSVHIDHRYVVTEHRQLVRNMASAPQTEGQYRLETVPGAVVTKFSYWNGDEEIRGELFERGAATAMYRTVTSARRDPGLLEQIAPGKFRYRIFPFAPSETKRVLVRWESLLPARGRAVEYRTPIALPNAAIVVEIDGATTAVRSDTHEIAVETLAKGRLRVRTVGLKNQPTTDFALRYELASAAASSFVHAAPGQDAFVSLDFPAIDDGSAAPARDVTFLVDRSGSEAGDMLDRARAAVSDAIGRLSRRDRLNVIAFDDTPTSLSLAPREATEEVVKEARRFVSRIRDGAGTDLAAALRLALSEQSGGERERILVLLTDGMSDHAEAVAAVEAGRHDVRIVALALGETVDTALLQQLTASRAGFWASARQAEDVSVRLTELLDRTRQAAVHNARLELVGAQGIQLAAPIPTTVVPGERIHVAVRCTARGALRARLVDLAGRALTSTVEIDVGTASVRPWVETAWAKARVDELLKTQERREDAIDLALLHDFTTPNTAFFAIPASETARVRGQLDAARRRKRDLAWAQGEGDGIAASAANGLADRQGAQVNAPPAPSPASKGAPDEVVVLGVEKRSGRGCAGCALVRAERGADVMATLLAAAAIGLLIARRRRSSPRDSLPATKRGVS